MATPDTDNPGNVTGWLADDNFVVRGAPNLIDFMARVEKFLTEHPNGRYEPLGQDPLPGSIAIVRIVCN